MELRVPGSKVECSHTFGEYYVYLSCMGLCLEANTVCPLDDKPLLYDSCPGQFLDRVYTIANNSYLTFARKANEGYYHPNYFQCTNKKCIDYKKVCNLIDDCGDAIEEVDCANHFICKETANTSKKHFISIEQKCDGIYDCFDFSDECNDSCGREILKSLFERCLTWTMGILAVSLNTYALIKGLTSVSNNDSEKTLITKVLVIIIGLGDFLTGLYLVALSVYDTIIFGRRFCNHQADWLTGTACAVLGAVSTLGSQLSLFAMTILSIIRANGVVRNTKNLTAFKSKLKKRSFFTIIIQVFVVVSTSLFIALVPFLPSLEDYFVQGIYYDPSYKVFIGFPDKARHFQILETYYNNTVQNGHMNRKARITPDLSWQAIGEKVNEMFSKEYGELKGSPVHFYGNDGVCLFKYFVRSDDARRTRQKWGGLDDITNQQGDLIVWIMMGVNLFCVILITICYAFINVIVMKSSQDSGSNQNPDREKQDKDMQRRIALLIATDFLCWVPFIIVSSFHNLKIIDATGWYVSFVMIVLPLNSILNPLIYEKQLRELVIVFILFLCSKCAALNRYCVLRMTGKSAEPVESQPNDQSP
jgi:hypothetical protein